jgi:adenylate cyclase class IV
MIELELKYKLSKIPDAFNAFSIIKMKKQSDVYYDTNDYILIKAGNFLRIRNNEKMDFKIDIDDATHLYCKETSFMVSEIGQKISEINQVFMALGLPASNNVEDTGIENFLLKNGFSEIARIDKTRSTFKLDEDCTLCIDEVENLGLFLEAEIMLDSDIISQAEVEAKKSAIIKRLTDCNIIDESSQTFNIGYVELFLLEHNPKVYELGKFKL